jgi:hypothetical protein
VFSYNIKGPKLEKFVAGLFTQSRLVWIGELETRPKNFKKTNGWGLKFLIFIGEIFFLYNDVGE